MTKLKQIMLSILVLFGSVAIVSPATATMNEGDERTDALVLAQKDMVRRTYLAILGREPEAEGLEAWVESMRWPERPEEQSIQEWVDHVRRPKSHERVVWDFLHSDEFVGKYNTTEDSDYLEVLYLQVLGRESDPDGLSFWLESFSSGTHDRVSAALFFINSDEFVRKTGTLPPPSPEPHWSWREFPHFVDSGNGVAMPQEMLSVRHCESKDSYVIKNPTSSARGAYQFLTESWKWYGHAARYGAVYASLATRVQQDEAALLTWLRSGLRPWHESRGCWRYLRIS